MSEWFKIDQAPHFDVVQREVEARGFSGLITGRFSPFDIPTIAKVDVIPGHGVARVGFRYLGPTEPLSDEAIKESMRLKVGKQSNRIYEINTSFPHLKSVEASDVEKIQRRVAETIGELIGPVVVWNWLRRIDATKKSMIPAEKELEEQAEELLQPA